MNFVNYIADRLKEASTYRGLAWLATAAGIVIQPTLLNSIMAVGTAAAGLIGVLFPDKSKT